MDNRVASGILWSSTVTLWCSDGVDTHCFLLCCFLFIAVYPHVCMCTEMFQSAASDAVGDAHFFIMHENKSHNG